MVYQHRRHSVDSQRRKYALPPSSGGPKDDLHEWSIYRQNLTSTLADSVLSGSNGVGISSTRSSARGRGPLATAGTTNLPYGEFQMHDHTVESVLNRAKRQDPFLGHKGQVYLRFGLPRVNLMDEKYEAPEGRADGVNFKRRSQSEMDIRRAVLEAPATRGPYYVKSSGSMDLMNLIGTRPFQRQQSIEFPMTPPIRASQRSIGSHLRAPLSVALPSVNIDVPSSSHSRTHFTNTKRITHISSSPPAVGNRHHHGHYFSNLNLFTPTITYNYLRYAKANELRIPIGKHPHLQLKNITFDLDTRTTWQKMMMKTGKCRRVLDEISMEMFGGETLAIMYTSKQEVTTLLSLVSNRHCLKGTTEGSFFVNGLPMSPKIMGHRMGFVCQHHLFPLLTVKEHLRLQCAFIKSAAGLFPSYSLISSLIETLALAPFQNCLISDIGNTEKQRVKIARQLLLDTDILLLDDIFDGMDLYDMAFLMDYLRDWASKLNRIVISAMNPPSFELLSMFGKTALLASGRLIYFGQTERMINYFQSMDYPCPLFKNACDYYVDLVTQDHLTVEVAMESSERIRRLSESWHRAAPPLTEPNPDGLAPPAFRHCNSVTATFWIYCRFWLIFLNRPWRYINEVVYCFLISLIIGAIFYQLTTAKQAGINDRIGLFYSILILAHIPNLLLNIDRIYDERLLTFSDKTHSLYPSPCFIIAKLCFEFPLALLVYMAYCIPVYFMAQLRPIQMDNGRTFLIYVGYTTLHCLATRMMAWAWAYMCEWKTIAAIGTGLFVTFFSLTSGIPLHPSDGWFHFAPWMSYLSPTRWIIHILLEQELIGNITTFSPLPQTSHHSSSSILEFGCDSRETKFGSAPCRIVSGMEALKFANLTGNNSTVSHNSIYSIAAYSIAAIIHGGLAFVSILISFIALATFSYWPQVKPVRRDS